MSQVEKEYWTEGISNDKATEYGTFYLEATGRGIAPRIPMPEPDEDAPEPDMDILITTPSDAAKALWIARGGYLLLTAWFDEYNAWDWESTEAQE